MAGQIKVDSINADSNLALKIANTAVAFIDSNGLRPTSGNVSLDATATSKLYLPSANTVAIQTAGVTGLSISSSQVVTLANALPVTSGGTGVTTSTGTGAVVLGTSPTITTPVISGNLNLDSAGTTGIRVPSANTIAFHTAGTQQAGITTAGLLQFNSGYGSVATAYGCRAWATMNCVSFTVTAGGNVSSITNYGTGDNLISFTNAMPDANYSLVGASVKGAGGPSATNSAWVTMGENPTTTGTGFGVLLGNGSAANRNIGYVAVFR